MEAAVEAASTPLLIPLVPLVPPVNPSVLVIHQAVPLAIPVAELVSAVPQKYPFLQ
jgi:hypothetical protein